MPFTEGKTKTICISDVKYILPVDKLFKVTNFQMFGRK